MQSQQKRVSDRVPILPKNRLLFRRKMDDRSLFFMPISFVEYYQIMKRENPSLKLQGNVRTIMSNVLLFNAQKLFFSLFRGVTRTKKDVSVTYTT